MSSALQFGVPAGIFFTRQCVYGIIRNVNGEVLVIQKPNGRCHLPGGGIEQGEDPVTALIREITEETGSTVEGLTYLCSAKQFFPHSDKGPLNKVADFYTGHLVRQDDTLRVEMDHVPVWMNVMDIAQANMGEFQQWAVRQAGK